MKRKPAQVQFSRPWSERLGRLRFDRFGFVLIFCVLGAGGAAWLLQGAGSAPQSQAVGSPAVYSFDMQIEGEVVGLSPSQLNQCEVTLSFPQLPYQLTKGWQELKHPRPGAFVVPLQLRARVPASLCQLRLDLGGKRFQGSKVQLEAGKLKATLPPFQVNSN